MAFRQPNIETAWNNERGSTLLLVLFILVILTVLGFAASRMSEQEIRMAANDRDHQGAIYAAEAGVARMKSRLNSALVDGNRANLASGAGIDWDFALAWPEIPEDIGKFGYTVRVINNIDSAPATPTDDQDQLIFIESSGSGPNNSSATIRVLVNAQLLLGGSGGYTGQAGGNGGKNFNSNDKNAISDTSSVNLGNI